jgi:CheY-like chemotaxis protein
VAGAARARPRGGTLSLVVAIVPDLFFAAKLQATARATGAKLVLVPIPHALERCAVAPPARVLVDLHAAGALALVRALKADARTARVPLVGFYSHVDTGLRAEALAAGADEALPRSAFVARLPALLADGAAPPPAHEEQ